MRDSYSLVLHDDTPHSNNPEMERLLAAHVIYNLLTSSRFFVSDSQIVGTRNFRKLLRHNTTIRKMVEDKLVVVLVRKEWKEFDEWDKDNQDSEFYWDTIQSSFIRNEKMRTTKEFYSIKHELKFLEENAATENWDYREISDNFTNLLRGNLTSCLAQDRLGDTLYERVKSLVDQEIDEKPKGDSLGTTFVENKLLTGLPSEGFVLSDEQRSFLRSCYIGPYAANLPHAKGLLPHYTDDLAEAFEIMRGCKLESSEPETKKIRERSLESSFLVEGLLRLTPDDIHEVRDGLAFKQFTTLSVKENGRMQEFAEILVVYQELIFDIEKKIVKRLDPSATLAYQDTPLQSTVRWFTGETASACVGEAVSFAINDAEGHLKDVTDSLIGLGVQQIFGRVKRWVRIDEKSTELRKVHTTIAARKQLEKDYDEKIVHNEHLDETSGSRNISEVYLDGSQ